MAFPSSPFNGQTTTVNGITYVYSASTQSWTRQSVNFNQQFAVANTLPSTSTTTGALTVAGGAGIAGTLTANTIVVTGGLTWANGLPFSNAITGNIANPAIFFGNSAIGGVPTMVDSLAATGNVSARWTTTSTDYTNSRFKYSIIETINDGTTVYATEYATIKSNDAYEVATFTANIVNGSVTLWATGDSPHVSVVFERLALGSQITGGYLVGAQGNVGPVGPAWQGGTVSNAVVVANTTTATSATTGALQVTGGVGIGGNLYVGGNVVVLGNTITVNQETINTSEVVATTLTAGAIYDSNNRVVTSVVSNGAGNLVVGNSAPAYTLSLPITGPGATTVGGNTAIPIITTDAYGRITGLTSASISTTLLTVGTSGTGSISIANQPLIFSGLYGVSAVTSGTTVTIGTPQDLRTTASPTFTGLNASGQVNLTSATPSTSTGTGALLVSGGVGIQGNLWVGGNINFTGQVTSSTFNTNSAQFTGNASGFGALYAGIPTGFTVQPQTTIQVSSNFNGYAQLNQQNINSGSQASSDFIATADNGTANDTYIDVGIGSSSYNYSGFAIIRPNDGYVLVQGNTTTGGGNLILNTGAANDVIIATGGSNPNNEVMRVTSGNVVNIKSTNAATSTTTGALQVAGGVGVQGNLWVGGTINNPLISNITSNVATLQSKVYANANVSSYLAGTVSVGTLTVTGTTTLQGTVQITGGNEFVTNDMYVNGNLYVAGNTTTVNATSVTTNDLQLKLASNAVSAAATNSAGIVTPYSAFTYYSTNNVWSSNVGITATSGYFSGNAFGLSSTAPSLTGVGVLTNLAIGTTNGNLGAGVNKLTISNGTSTGGVSNGEDVNMQLGAATLYNVVATSSYNGLVITNNWTGAGTQGTSALPSWFVDIGGRGSYALDAITFGRIAPGAGSTSQMMVLNSSGYLGVGTTSPSALLTVQTTGSTTGTLLLTDGTNTTRFGTWDGANNRIEAVNRPLFITSYTGGVSLGYAGSAGLTVNSSNYVGIGTTTPPERLQVAGAIRSTSNANNFSGAVGAIFDYYSSQARIGVYDGTNTSTLSFNTSGVLTTPSLTATTATVAGRNVRNTGSIDLSSLSTSTFYPVIFPVEVVRTATRLRIQNDLNSNVPSWATHPSGFSINLDWSVNGNGWGTNNISRVINNYYEDWTNSLICGGITQFGNSSYECVYLRGGGVYFWETDGPTNCVASVITSSTTVNSQTIAPISSAANTPYTQGAGSYGVGSLYAYSGTFSGPISKGSGSFRIDHPLPSLTDTHQLVHSFIEGPQADLIYRGTVALVNGSATIDIDKSAGMTDGTFVVLCRNVQCFTTNESSWDAVRGSVTGNQLTITCQNPESAATISWMVIGERQDPHMIDTDWTDDNGKVIVEPLKPQFAAPTDGETRIFDGNTFIYSSTTGNWSSQS